MRKYILPPLLLVSLVVPAGAQSQPARLERTRYQGRIAYRLSNGRTEAVVVPELGRVMRYGLIGGANWLWNAPSVDAKGVYKNWGGAKTWPAPQLDWGTGQNWPPNAAWDGQPHRAQVLPGARLRLISNVWPEFGLRLTREFSFDANGEFLVRQTFTKVRGNARLHSLWSVVHVQPEAIFMTVNPKSPYRAGIHWITGTSQTGLVTRASPSLLRQLPGSKEQFKVGVDAPVAAIVAVKGNQAMLIRAPRSAGNYPDGALSAGFPVELYDSGGQDPRWHHLELELLSPLRPFYKGARWTHTMRWSLHRLPSADWRTPAVVEAVQQLLQPRPSATVGLP